MLSLTSFINKGSLMALYYPCLCFRVSALMTE